jgi:hypothetical protein
VPTFKSYVNKDGYYINARPSNVGNITYQIDPEAAAFVRKLGYDSDDELPWGIVKPLRVAGLIYTNEQGVAADDEGVPGLDPDKLPTLSDTEREKLAAYLDERGDVSAAVRDRFRSLLDTGTSDADTLAASLSQKFDTDVEVEIDRRGGTDGDYGATNLDIRYEVANGLFGTKHEVTHHISAVSSPSVDEWYVSHPYGDDWGGLAEVTEEKITIMETLDEVSDQLSFEFYPYKGESTI